MAKTKFVVMDVQQAYFEWLCSIIDQRRRSLDGEYLELAEVLHSSEFYDKIPNDDNRAKDGRALREEFAASNRCDLPLDDARCTVLEMLIALAKRMDDILYDSEKGSQVARWFWLLISNLKLRLYLPTDPDAHKRREANLASIRRFVERDYSESGRGGLFPLTRPRCNQREVEIWYQMMAYIEECTQ